MKTHSVIRRPLYALGCALVAGTALTACIPDPPVLVESPPPAGGAGPVIDRNPPLLEVPVDMAGNDQRGTGRAIMLRVPHTPDPGEPSRVTLEKTRVYVRRGDSGPITVGTFDLDGRPIDSWQAPDPLGSAEDPRGDEARYGVPYQPELGLVEITDSRSGRSITVKVDEVVRQHCVSDPTDNICRDIDLRTDVTLDDYSVRTGVVGESIPVPVHVAVTNSGTDWARVSGSMSVFGILDGVEVSTVDATSFTPSVLDPTATARYDLKYVVTCRVAGDHRVFIGADFYDPIREAVDSNTANNRWNTWFDVKCADA